jgi:hypothetical protein
LLRVRTGRKPTENEIVYDPCARSPSAGSAVAPVHEKDAGVLLPRVRVTNRAGAAGSGEGVAARVPAPGPRSALPAGEAHHNKESPHSSYSFTGRVAGE